MGQVNLSNKTLSKAKWFLFKFQRKMKVKLGISQIQTKESLDNKGIIQIYWSSMLEGGADLEYGGGVGMGFTFADLEQLQTDLVFVE